MQRTSLTKLHRLLFTVSITCISRVIVWRDRLIGRLAQAEPDFAMRSTVSRHRIPSGGNVLESVLAMPAGPVESVLLICHGIGETVEYWRAAQQFLAAHGTASLVFDYSGYGKSTGRIGAEQLERDAVAAFEFLQSQVSGLPVSILGFSLGSGIAAAVVSQLQVHHLVLCASFTSFREAARIGGWPRWLQFLVSPIWETLRTIGDCPVPVMIVHGDADPLFPVWMAEELRARCGADAELIVVPKLTHNQPFQRPHLAYWGPILARIAGATEGPELA